jgi:Concanavalin A-like lectin/glucanases superfamily
MSRTRRCLALIGALLLACGLLLAQRTRPATDPAAVQITPPPGGILPFVTGPATTAPPASRRIGTATSPASVRYTFDGGVDRPVTDLHGGHPLRPLAQNGGVLRLVPEGVGLAVAYPRRCTLPTEADCPRAILEGVRDDGLNPGRRTMRYGASVRLTHADLDDGANVLQKGYSVGGVSQFKLQVDHRLGHPSCVLTGNRRRIFRAEPWLDVADGRWHDLMCTRGRDRLTLTVDGVERAWVRVPRRLSIANAEPLRVGGKGPAVGNDQYAGEIDDVFLVIGD